MVQSTSNKKTDRKKQLAIFNVFAKLNNVRFTTPYFQAISGQTLSTEMIVKSIKCPEFKKIVAEKNPQKIRKRYAKNQPKIEVVLVGRDQNGRARGTINLTPDNEISVYMNDPEEQKRIIEKNIEKGKISKQALSQLEDVGLIEP